MKSRTWMSMIVVNLFATLVLVVVTSPSAQAQTLKVLHAFTNGGDGGSPRTGLSIDRAGNLYGTTYGVAGGGSGAVFELKRAGSGWILNPLHDFTSGNDGANPSSRVVFGPDGNLYGTTAYGGVELALTAAAQFFA